MQSFKDIYFPNQIGYEVLHRQSHFFYCICLYANVQRTMGDWGRPPELTLLSFQQIKIVDKEGNILPVNTPGEICIRGYGVMIGYWGEKEQTESALKPTGWLHSGWDSSLEVFDWINSFWSLVNAFLSLCHVNIQPGFSMTLIVRQHTSITDTLRGCFCLKKKNGYYIMSKREINMVVTKSELIVKTGKWGRQQTSQAWAVLLSHFRPYDDTRRRREVLCLAQEYKNILPARVERSPLDSE